MSIVEIFQRARELEKKRDVIHLEVGQVDLPVPAESQTITTGNRSPYVDIFGIEDLRREITRFVEKRHDVQVDTDEILVTAGGRFAVFSAMSALIPSDKSTVVLDPSWPGYEDCAEVSGTHLRRVDSNLGDGWEPDTRRLEEEMSRDAGMVVLNSPNNPTGKVLDAETVEQILELADNHGCVVLSDEAYTEYSFTRKKSLVGRTDEGVISVFSLSKSHAMAGHRIGFAISDKETIKKLAVVHSALLTCVPEHSQRAALAALRDEEALTKNRVIIEERVELAVETLKKYQFEFYEPDGGIYLFPKLGDEAFDSSDFAQFLLEEKGVAVAPGTAFGSYGNFARISLGTKRDKIERGLTLMGETLEDYER